MAELRDLRGRLAAGETLVGAWSSLPGAAAAALVAATPGLDYLVTDLQHGAAVETDLPAIWGVAVAQGVTPLARVRASTPADVGRALDLGAHGVFLPNVGGADHVAEVLGHCRLGPDGVRSFGRLVGGAPDPLRCIVLETRQAWQELDRILDLDDLDGVYIGPMDLAYSLGHGDTPRDDHMEGVKAEIVRACVDRGMPVGVHTSTAADALRYTGIGVQFVNAAADGAVLAEALRANVEQIRRHDTDESGT